MAQQPKTLSKSEVEEKLEGLNQWKQGDKGIYKIFQFDDYAQTTSFANAVSWLAGKIDHHPDIAFGYSSCRVSFITHSIDGISDKDIHAALKLEELIQLPVRS